MKAKLDALEEKFIEEEAEESTQELSGMYLPFSRVWKEEGEDEDALAAAREYVKSVVKMQREGRLGPKKQKWVRTNKMTKRVEYLYVRSHVAQRWVDRHTMLKTRTAGPPAAATGGTGGTGGSGGAGGGGGTLPAPPAGGKGGRGSGKKPKNTTPKPQIGKKPNPPRASPRKSEAQTYSCLKDTKGLHTKMKSTMASASDILSEVLTNPQWKKIVPLTAASQKAREKVEAWRVSSTFWRQWTVCRDIADLKPDMHESDLEQELRTAPQLDSLLNDLADAVADLLSHQDIEARRARRGS